MSMKAMVDLKEVTIIIKDGEHEQRIIPKLLFYPNYLYNLLNIYSVPIPVKIRRASSILTSML